MVLSGTTSAPATELSPTATPSGPVADGITITTSDSDFGPMLFDRAGQAIYLFEKETTSRPDCYGECRRLAAGAHDREPAGDRRGTRGPAGHRAPRRRSTQVTYGGHPLYFYAHESPGQVLCHDVVDYGGRWLVVTPEVPGPV